MNRSLNPPTYAYKILNSECNVFRFELYFSGIKWIVNLSKTNLYICPFVVTDDQ